MRDRSRQHERVEARRPAGAGAQFKSFQPFNRFALFKTFEKNAETPRAEKHVGLQVISGTETVSLREGFSNYLMSAGKQSFE